MGHLYHGYVCHNQMVLKSENVPKKRKSWKLGAEPTASATVFLILLTPGSGPLSYARMGKLHLADDLAMTELWPQLFVDDYFGG